MKKSLPTKIITKHIRFGLFKLADNKLVYDSSDGQYFIYKTREQAHKAIKLLEDDCEVKPVRIIIPK